MCTPRILERVKSRAALPRGAHTVSGKKMRGVVLQVENYILSGSCGRSIDTDLLAEYGEAGVDLGFKPAKYMVARPTATGRRDEHDTVNVYPSGKVVCLGARSVERAQTAVRMVLRRLGVVAGTMAAGAAAAVGDAGVAAEGEGDNDAGTASVRYVVMSGCIFGRFDVHRAIPRLREKYEVTLDSDVFSGYFVRSRGGGGGGDGDDNEGGVSIQVFAPDMDRMADECDAGSGGGGDGAERNNARTPLLCRGPTVQDVRMVVGDVYRTIVESNGNGASLPAVVVDTADVPAAAGATLS